MVGAHRLVVAQQQRLGRPNLPIDRVAVGNMVAMTIGALRSMFAEMVVGKNIELAERFYDPGFVLYSNGIRQEFAAFTAEHRKVYATDITYQVEYDDDAWVSDVDNAGTGQIAGRIWITTALPGEDPKRLEVILIVAYRRGRIRTIWELTYPNWADLAAFEDYRTE